MADESVGSELYEITGVISYDTRTGETVFQDEDKDYIFHYGILSIRMYPYSKRKGAFMIEGDTTLPKQLFIKCTINITEIEPTGIEIPIVVNKQLIFETGNRDTICHRVNNESSNFIIRCSEIKIRYAGCSCWCTRCEVSIETLKEIKELTRCRHIDGIIKGMNKHCRGKCLCLRRALDKIGTHRFDLGKYAREIVDEKYDCGVGLTYLDSDSGSE